MLAIVNISSVHRGMYPLSNMVFFLVIRTLTLTENFGLIGLFSLEGYKFLQTSFSFTFRLASTGVILIVE